MIDNDAPQGQSPTLQDVLDELKKLHARLDKLKGISPSERKLLERIDELEAENEDLQSRLDEITDICGSE